VGPAAALLHEPADFVDLKALLLSLAFIVFGFVPNANQGHAPVSVPWALVAVAATLLALAYSTMNLAWPPVGFEAAPLLALVAVILAILSLAAALAVALRSRRRRAVSVGVERTGTEHEA
jgi:hypothetical protein